MKNIRLTVSRKVLAAEAIRFGLELMRSAKPGTPLRLAASALGSRCEVEFSRLVPGELERALKEDPEGWREALKHFGFRGINWLVIDVVAGVNRRIIEMSQHVATSDATLPPVRLMSADGHWIKP